MRKAFLLFLSFAASALANHPFVGENADKDVFEREDGSIAVKLTKRKAPFDKYKGRLKEKWLIILGFRYRG